MDIKTLTEFFKWCTIINTCLFAFTTLMFMVAPDLLYLTQSWLFPITREAFNLVLYAFLGLYKITIIVFNVVPWISLLIVAKREAVQ